MFVELEENSYVQNKYCTKLDLKLSLSQSYLVDYNSINTHDFQLRISKFNNEIYFPILRPKILGECLGS